ncbi:MAG: MarR family transcriptional regulator [Comamonadaceae bacterium]|nr:MAG: MarR family transcriptional regulator [Comamonadaceae bacterium]
MRETERTAMPPNDLTHLLEQAQRRVSRDLDRELAQVGASGEQWRVLDSLADEVGRPMGELATMLSMNPPTMTKLVDRMVASGLVQRIADVQDSRRVLVYITDAGLELVAKLSSRADAFHAGLSAALSPKDADKLQKLLTCLLSRQV